MTDRRYAKPGIFEPTAYRGRRVASVVEKIEAYAAPEPNTGCILWAGAWDSHGYGKFRSAALTTRLAHRAAYIVAYGDIPEGMVLDHKCRVRCCINPLHLEVTTNKENSMRGESVWARNNRKTHCHNGHPFSGENFTINSFGSRVCRTCVRDRRRHKSRGIACENPASPSTANKGDR